jgi:hypothetical protein
MFPELNNEQSRQLIDVRQLYSVQQQAASDLAGRFSGTMFWKTVSGADYLYRRRKNSDKSLGPRSPKTEEQYHAFSIGKVSANEQYIGTSERLKAMAPVNKALGLGRVPKPVSKVLRKLEKERLLGREIVIVGTNALYAYEAAAGIFFSSGILATGDVDLLYDSRGGLKLWSENVSKRGLIGLLKSVDESYKKRRAGDFCAVNKLGFMVDLITPAATNVMDSVKQNVGDSPDDLSAVEISGLIWLLNVPKFEAVAIGEDGLPVPIVCADPRAFAAHKLWLSEQEDRDPLKKNRDRHQAEAVIQILKNRMPHYPITGNEGERVLTALPSVLREEFYRVSEN